MQPLVSVLMTSYNRENYIADAIQSVLDSTYKNIELIIVDDRSTDNTLEIARSFEKKDSRIRVYVNEVNLGDYDNRNKAASYANGEYLKYLDSDDIIYPYSIQIMVDYVQKYPHVGLVFCDYLNQDNSAPFPITYSPYDAYAYHYLKTHLFYAGPGGTIIPRKVFLEYGGFSGKRGLGDTELWLKIALRYPILKIQTSLIWWRTHYDQESSIESRNPTFLAYRYNLWMEYLNQSPLNKDERKIAKYRLDKLLARKILSFIVPKFRLSTAVTIMKAAPGFTFWDLFKAFDISNRVKKIF